MLQVLRAFNPSWLGLTTDPSADDWEGTTCSNLECVPRLSFRLLAKRALDTSPRVKPALVAW